MLVDLPAQGVAQQAYECSAPLRPCWPIERDFYFLVPTNCAEVDVSVTLVPYVQAALVAPEGKTGAEVESDPLKAFSEQKLTCRVAPELAGRIWSLRFRGNYYIKWPQWNFRSPRPVRIALAPEALFAEPAPAQPPE